MATDAISASSARAVRRSVRQRLSSRRTQKTIAFYLFIAPWLLGFIFLTALPLLAGLGVSMTNYDGLNLATMKFLGLKNYIRIFQDEAAMESFRRTLSWTLLNTPLWLSLSFLLAYILNHATRGKGVFRTLYYLPSVVPLVGVRWVGNVFFNQSFGLINQVISVFRPGTAIQWLTEYALFSLTSLAVWTGLGAGVVVFLAALQDIPTELKEAAVIDGVSKLQVFRHVIIPLTTPVIFYQLVLSLSVALQYYALPMLLAPNNVSNAGTLSTPPARNAYLFMVHSIRQAFGYQRYGYATALNWFLVLVIAAFTGFLFWTAPKWVHYETEVQV